MRSELRLNLFPVKLFLLFLLPFLPLMALGQNRKAAEKEIESLRNGSLLVRLKTGELQAAAMERSGNATEANEYRRKQKEENLAIVKAFIRNFRFCPVYFFFSSCSQKISNKDFEGCLLNNELLPDSSRIPPTSVFLIAEFGNSEKQQIEGLIVMDATFKQLAKPFPFLIRKYENPMAARSYDEMVLQLEKKLRESAPKK